MGGKKRSILSFPAQKGRRNFSFGKKTVSLLGSRKEGGEVTLSGAQTEIAFVTIRRGGKKRLRRWSKEDIVRGSLLREGRRGGLVFPLKLEADRHYFYPEGKEILLFLFTLRGKKKSTSRGSSILSPRKRKHLLSYLSLSR